MQACRLCCWSACLGWIDFSCKLALCLGFTLLLVAPLLRYFFFVHSTDRLYVQSQATYWQFWWHTALALNEILYLCSLPALKSRKSSIKSRFFLFGPEYYLYFGQRPWVLCFGGPYSPLPRTRALLIWWMHGIMRRVRRQRKEGNQIKFWALMRYTEVKG